MTTDEEQPQPKRLAVFDFDDTLIHGDSMRMFFIMIGGWPTYLAVCAKILMQYIVSRCGGSGERETDDRGTYFKQQLLDHLIAKRPATFFVPITASLRTKLVWNEPMRRKLLEHHQQGCHIVIASGSLDLYLPELVKDLPHDALLCTEIEVANGITTGVMTKGNCVRQGKADRLTAYLKEQDKFDESWGYGNYPDDIPMLALMQHRVIV